MVEVWVRYLSGGEEHLRLDRDGKPLRVVQLDRVPERDEVIQDLDTRRLDKVVSVEIAPDGTVHAFVVRWT